MTDFKTKLSGSGSAPKEINATASFETQLKTAASESHVTVEVQYDTVGSAKDTEFDTSDVTKTFDSFRKNCTPVSCLVYYHHYSWLRGDLPASVPMDGETYRLLTGVYSRARFIVVLNGLAPGSTTTRLARRDFVVQMFKTIYAERLNAKGGTSTLKRLLADLDDLRTQFLNLLHRQDLVVQYHSLTYDDLKK